MFKKLFGKSKPPEPSPLKELTPDEFDKVKFKARIAFIDDEDISHVGRLQKDGYNITHYPDIDNIDDFIRKKYHVVVLDIQGVGTDLAPNTEGWGLLNHLKATCPNVVVIMFTGAEWSITKYKDEADKADDFIGKDLEFLDFKRKLDNGIKKAFSANYHFEVAKQTIQKEISNAQTLNDIKRLIDTYGGNKKTALEEIKKITSNEAVIEGIDKFLSITDSVTSLLA